MANKAISIRLRTYFYSTSAFTAQQMLQYNRMLILKDYTHCNKNSNLDLRTLPFIHLAGKRTFSVGFVKF